jgi:hypothetical protein
VSRARAIVENDRADAERRDGLAALARDREFAAAVADVSLTGRWLKSSPHAPYAPSPVYQYEAGVIRLGFSAAVTVAI